MPHTGREIKCTKLRDNKNPALVGYSSPLWPCTPASRYCFHCFSPRGRNQRRVLLSLDCTSLATTEPVRGCSARPDFNKKEQMRRLWQQRSMFPWQGHSWWMKKVALCPDTCIFQLEKFRFTMAHAWSRAFPLQQEDFTLCATSMSFCTEHLSNQQNEGTGNRRSLQALKTRSWGRRTWEQSNPPPGICLIICLWHIH